MAGVKLTSPETSISRYGPLFAKLIAWRDVGGQRELTKGVLEARGRLEGGRPRDLADVGALHMFGVG